MIICDKCEKELTVKDIINTMTTEQKNTLYYYIGLIIKEKVKAKPPYADIGSFNENQRLVFNYLIGAALDEAWKSEILEIVKE